MNNMEILFLDMNSSSFKNLYIINPNISSEILLSNDL